MSDLSPDDLSSDASALLDAARGGFDPPAEAKSRMRRGIATAMGVATGAVTSGAAATSAAATAATGSAATATGLVASGSAAASVVTAAGTAATTSAVVGTGIGATLSAKVVVGLAVVASVAFGTVVVTNNLDAPVASVPSASAQPSLAPSATPLAMIPKPVASVITAASAASVAPLPVAPEPPPLVRPTAPREAPSVVPAASVTVSAVVATSAPAPVRGDLAREADMLRSALAAPPAQALALLDDHARQFPRGALAEERDAQRVVTLCQLGRRDEASVSYTRFVTAFPGSIHRARLERTCAVAP